MNKNKTNKKSGKSAKRNKKSLKGQWGKVGAPPKKVNWPNRPFTMAQLFARNTGQCELSLRNKVEAAVEAKTILALMPVKQPGGAVGRPKSRFVLKENFDNTMTLLGDKEPKAPKARKVKAVAVVAVEPVQPAVDPTPAVAPETPAEVAEVPAAPPAPVAPVFAEPVAAPAVETTATEAVAAPEPIIG